MGHVSIHDERYFSLTEAAVAYDLDAHDLEYFCKNGLVQSRKIAGRWHIAESSLKQYAHGKEMPEPEVDEAEMKKFETLAASQMLKDVDQGDESEQMEYVVSPVAAAPPRRTKVLAKKKTSRPLTWRAVAVVLVLSVATGSALMQPQIATYTASYSLSAVAAAAGTVGALGVRVGALFGQPTPIAQPTVAQSLPELPTPVMIPATTASSSEATSSTTTDRAIESANNTPDLD